jgi:hypothetical protein
VSYDTAVDDHSRLAYSEILGDEKKETATAFWTRAQTFFTSCGITVERVLTDNGSCYKSHLWRDALAEAGITHKRTRPYRPQTNGKVKRLNRTLLDEWAYARPYRSEQERRDAFPQWPISLLAKRRFGVGRVAARVNDAENTWLFDPNWGVDVAVPAATPLISLIEEATGATDTVALLQLSRAGATVVRDGRPTVPNPEVRLLPGDEPLRVSHEATEQEIHAAFQ